jgi:hypothetical protein
VKKKGSIAAIVVVVLIVLWLLMSSANAAEKKAAGDVSLGDDFEVDFRKEGGEWNPFYVVKPSVELEGNQPDSVIFSSEAFRRAAAALAADEEE